MIYIVSNQHWHTCVVLYFLPRYNCGYFCCMFRITFFLIYFLEIKLYWFFLQKEGQRLSTTCQIFCGCFFILILDRFYLAIFGTVSWLDWLYFLSIGKVVITLLKFIPQAYLSYQRQSTQGFNINSILLDLHGSIFSLIQMFLDAWNHGMYFSQLVEIFAVV